MKEGERQDLGALKSAVDLVEFMDRHGVQLRREGTGWKGHCPFHEDDTPSFSVDPEKGLWHCFGCGEGGDALTFLQKKQGLSFSAAVEALSREAGVPADPPAPRPSRPSPVLDATSVALLERVVDLYHEDLSRYRMSLSYLKERGLHDLEMLRAFRVGYCNGDRLSGIATPEERCTLGVLGVFNARAREHLTGCIVVPLRDREGRVVGLYGRRIREGGSSHRLLRGPRMGLFYPEAARGTRRVLLVEGVLDALACYQAGFRHVLALGGLDGKRAELLEHLRREGVREVLLVLDGDEPGRKGAEAVGRQLERAGFAWARADLPDGEDPLSFLTAHPAEEFRELLARAASCLEPPSPQPRAATAPSPPGPSAGDVTLERGELRYRVASVQRAGNGKLRVHLRLETPGGTHRDTLDLYSHKARRTWANRVAERFEVAPEEAERHLEDLVELLDSRPASEDEDARHVPELTPAEREEAFAFLRRPDLLEAILADMEALGYVGEEEAKLLAYLIGLSRKLERPLSGIVLSGSGAGKSYLVEMVESLTPPEDVVLYSRLSPQALGYLPKDFLKRKLLILEERTGGEAADYQIRTLQSKNRLSQAVVVKDPTTGTMRTRHFEVEGPIAYLETTTNSHLNPENTSRCFQIPLDESAEQTRRIHEAQRRARTVDGLARNETTERFRRRHHHAQRVLEPVRVVIPYVGELVFPDRWLRTRRDHERFLCLIEAVAFLQQHQRPIRELHEVRYLEATVEDYRIAHRLARRVLGVSLDELSRWARELLEELRRRAEALVGEGRGGRWPSVESVIWTRRQIREELSWPDRRVRESLEELVEMEHLILDRAPERNLYHYRLAPESAFGAGGGVGLLSPEDLELRLQRQEATRST